MELLTIDSSVFVAALHPADVFHGETEDFFMFLRKKDFQAIIPMWVVLEVGNSLIRLGVPRSSTEIREYFHPFQVIALDEKFVENAFPEMQRFRLKTGDAVVAATSALYGTKLITWDRLLRDTVGKNLPAFTPAEYVSEKGKGI